MKKTANLELPIYDNPETDVFNLEDWNIANQNLDNAFSALVEGNKLDIINSEVVDARKGKLTLKEKIDEIDTTTQEINSQLAQNVQQLDVLIPKVDSLASGSPKGTYATLSDLQTAYPTGNSNIYVVTADGNWYYWNGTAWTSGGVYQSTGLDTTVKNKIDTSYGVVQETTTIADVEVGKSYIPTAIFTNPTQSWYGWKNGFKPITFNKLIFTEDVTVAGSTYTCQILDSNSVKLFEKVITAPSIGNQQKLTFDFGQSIKMTSDFYISITSTEFVSFIAAEGYNNTNIVSSTLKSYGWLNGTSWSALNNFSHVLILDFITEEYKVDINKVNGLMSTGDGKKILCSDGAYRTTDEIRKIGITTENVNIIYPKYLYSVRNDVNTSRNYSLGLFVDHFLEGEKIGYDKDVRFSDNTLEKRYWSNVLSSDKETQSIAISFNSDKYIVPSFSTTLRKSKLSPNKDKVARVLCIGDSNFYGATNVSYAPYKKPFVSILKQMFELDKIDNGGVGGALLLGSARRLSFSENYKGQSREFTACTDGRSGWTAYGFSRHIKNYTPSQTTWDLLGLGNGTGTDYTGTQAQKDLIASTNQNYTTDISQSETTMLWNPYFDNSKTGDTKFSLAKYLERYRTMDDSGNRLTLGNGTGTYITSSNLNTIDLCTPTHVVIQLGQNDIDVGVSNTVTINNLKAIVNSIKAEFPSIVVIIAHNDRPGTMFPTQYGYPSFDCRMVLGGHDKTKDLVSKILTEFDGVRESENIYYCPNYFTQTNADSMDFNFIVNPLDGTNTNMKVKDFSNSPDAHPSAIGRADWAYQIYSLIRWTQS